MYSFYTTNTILSILILGCISLSGCAPIQEAPNILWITVEDMSPQLGSYGDPYAHTPTLDALASKGVVYTNAIATAPVCAVARNSIITGMHAASIGSQHMRCEGRLPQTGVLYPEALREAGYYVTNNVKTDYNLEMDPASIWDESSNKAHWRNRPDADQPFFAIFNFTTTHESRVNNQERYRQAIADVPAGLLKKPGEVPLPSYYPDTPEVRELWARYYNIITAMDRQVADVLRELEEDGLSDDTIVFFYSDHGAGLPRHKRWLFDSGLRIPLIVYTPTKYAHLNPHGPASQTDELISFVDLPATVLHLAGIPIPDSYQGRAFLGRSLTEQREFTFAGRDRMDERYDMQRAVRSKQFKYIRYYEAFKPYTQYMNTPEKGQIMESIRNVGLEGMPDAGKHILAPQKPIEALYKLDTDPHELKNLAQDNAYQNELEDMRLAHANWSDRVMDTGLIPETILRAWEDTHDQAIYDIARTEELYIALMREIASMEMPAPNVLSYLSHENAGVRYWASVVLGNYAVAGQIGNVEIGPLLAILDDPVPAVRIAAARAVVFIGNDVRALPVLQEMLGHSDEWVRLYAAQVLDEMGEKGRPAMPSLKRALGDSNKYVVRVANRALNELEGTSNEVP